LVPGAGMRKRATSSRSAGVSLTSITAKISSMIACRVAAGPAVRGGVDSQHPSEGQRVVPPVPRRWPRR
jgi:hypothetical protein